MSFIPEDIIEQVKNENDIVNIISEKVPLKKKGANYWGICPFHGEKTPSFSVSRDKQIYKCFGCGAGGNVFSFFMATENISFPEAVRKLAQRVGIEIPEDNKVKTEEDILKETVENINREAARFFHSNLKENSKAQEYLKNRMISPEIVIRFGLGFAKDSWDDLKKHLLEKGYTNENLKVSGLFGESKGRIYDRFRNRLIFPVQDHRGRVIGFGARVLDDSKPKYLNSPETPVFHKGTNLYGIYQLLKDNKKEDYVIICEGYMDCIALHQGGITNAVAALGTALTEYQARLLKRYFKKVIVSFDADEAGRLATLRGLDILSKEGLEVKILKIPDGKDPDDFIKSHGEKGFRNLIDNALTLMDFKIIEARRGLNLNKDEDKIKYFTILKPLFTSLDPVERDVYIGKVADDIGVSKESIYQSLGIRFYKKEETINISNNNLSKENFIESGHLRAQRYLLKLFLDGEDSVGEMDVEEFATETHREIFRLIKEYSGDNELRKKTIINTHTEGKLQSEIAMIDSLSDIPEDIPMEILINDFKKSLEMFNKNKRRKDIIKEVERLEKIGKTEESLELAKKLLDI